jgi:hypothetical protein
MKNEKLVSVDVEKLSQGLQTTFMGVALVFESLGASEAAEQVVVKSRPAETQATEPVAEESKLDKPAEEIVEPMAENEAEATFDAVAEAPTSVTVDDITKVIVAKIKQKRGNNAKIGQLLKSYGVDKVSSLPAEQYEAFLTDISQL